MFSCVLSALWVQSLWWPKGGNWSPKIVVPEGCEPPCRCQEPCWPSARASGALTCRAHLSNPVLLLKKLCVRACGDQKTTVGVSFLLPLCGIELWLFGLRGKPLCLLSCHHFWIGFYLPPRIGQHLVLYNRMSFLPINGQPGQPSEGKYLKRSMDIAQWVLAQRVPVLLGRSLLNRFLQYSGRYWKSNWTWVLRHVTILVGKVGYGHEQLNREWTQGNRIVQIVVQAGPEFGILHTFE